MLTPASLRDLYTSQNLPATTIALIANTSEITVRKALDRARIPLTGRRHGAARALTPERLAAEIQPGRTEIEIAAACGVSPSTISKYTRQHGLTTWRHTTAVQQLATMTIPADPDVITAIRGRGENQLRRVATAARHTTAREAATILCTNESALWSQIRAVERRVGSSSSSPARRSPPPAVARISSAKRNAQSITSTQTPPDLHRPGTRLCPPRDICQSGSASQWGEVRDECRA